MSMAIANLLEGKDGVIHEKGGMMAISHLLKRKQDGHLQATEWKKGCHLLGRKDQREEGWPAPIYFKGRRKVISHIFSKVRTMSDSHVLKGKDDDQLPYIKREGGKS